jgi:hypothetical protein
MPGAESSDLDTRAVAVRTDAVLGMMIDDGGLDRSILDAPPSILRRMVVEEARSAGLSEEDAAALADSVTASSHADAVARVVLEQLWRAEPLRDELDAATQRRDELMAIDPITITSVALFVAVLKVRRIKVSRKGGLDMSFEPIRSEVLRAVLDFVRGGG